MGLLYVFRVLVKPGEMFSCQVPVIRLPLPLILNKLEFDQHVLVKTPLI